jgi:heme-degrading monooxygenase HmoA
MRKQGVARPSTLPPGHMGHDQMFRPGRMALHSAALVVAYWLSLAAFAAWVLS